ncbi:MAG: patatin-like phospholipase family protein [Bacteroidetes bacterium]|nr:patatin-like phospholipase family protein [Bacteroidota bacterium]
MKNVSEHLAIAESKRILALDGGGIRGALSLGILKNIETILKERFKDTIPPTEFRLHHYYDLIGGTSTGAIIASALAIGMSVDEIIEKYKELGTDIFRKGGWLDTIHDLWKSKYDVRPLKKHLDHFFKDIKLADDTIKTGLTIVAKRLDSFSTWPLTNNPKAKYYTRNNFYLKDYVRASAAAPTYFIPEVLKDTTIDREYLFVDGGFSLMNNPSLQLFMIATFKGYNLHWKTGKDHLMITSVGTGRRPRNLHIDKYRNPNNLQLAQIVADVFMSDSTEFVELMMQSMSSSMTARVIDREIGDLSGDLIGGVEQFTYNRFNTFFEVDKMHEIGLNYSDEQLDSFSEMDNADNTDELIKIGLATGKKFVNEEHFPSTFDL